MTRRAWIEVVQPARGREYRWVLHLPDGKEVRSPQGYTTQRAAWTGWRRHKKNVAGAAEKR